MFKLDQELPERSLVPDGFLLNVLGTPNRSTFTESGSVPQQKWECADWLPIKCENPCY